MTGSLPSFLFQKESSWLVSFHIAGASVGSVVIFPLGGYLAAFFGWRSVFYATGILSTLWVAAWFALAHDHPAKHPRISEKERARLVRWSSTIIFKSFAALCREMK